MARSLAEVATYRRMEPDDVPFVKDAWLNSWRKSRYAGVIPNHLYYDTTRTTIEDLFSRGAVTIVAEYKGELLGFACGEVKDGKKVLHYLFTKDAFLRRGVDERLLNELPGEGPGWFTFALERFLKDRTWNHAPEIARRQKL